MTTRSTLTGALFILLILTASGCGSRVKGTYTSEGNGFFEKMDFKSDGKVEITFMGMTKEGSYVVDGDKVKVTVGTDTQILTINGKGCIEGGGLIGTYCKGGKG
jgi:hypothetical protein